MEFEEHVDQILREAYDNIIEEGLKRELDDFKKIEDFLTSKGLIEDSSTEIWYMSMNDDPNMEIVNPEEESEENDQALAIKYKGTYEDLYVALQDSEMIH